MPWQSIREVRAWLNAIADVGRLEEMFNLHEFVLQAVFPEDYRADERWLRAISLTAAGEEILERTEALARLPPADVRLAFLGKFFHHDVLVDHVKSDLSLARDLLSEELLTHRLRWPFRFGRMLYDKFYELPDLNLTEHMESGYLARLLADTPQGVYQVGSLLSGPLGFLTSREVRYVPPVLALPLWHCSDTGCVALHHVRLLPPKIAVVEAYSTVKRVTEAAVGPESEWLTPFVRLHRRGRWPAGRPYRDLPAFLSEAIVGIERTALLTAALTGPNAALLRESIARPPRPREAAQGTPEQVASRLTEAEQLQLLLLLFDKDLVFLIDECIYNGSIRIPANEKRRSNLVPPRVYQRDSVGEVSSLGIRSGQSDPFLFLLSAIWHAYEAGGLLDELGWRVRKRVGVPPRRALAEYARVNSPTTLVRDLVLASMPITMAISAQLDLVIHTDEPVESIVRRLLWKCGFDVPGHEDELIRFAARLAQFTETLVRTGPIRTEDDRENIRSIGVNLFVSVEHFLEQLIAFNVWLLSSDHFVRTRYIFERQTAVATVGEILGTPVRSGDQTVSWDPSGGNSLGTLMVFLEQATRWMRRLCAEDRTAVTRPEEDMPHYAADPVRTFPYRHNAFWADTDPGELLSFVDGFDAIATQVARANPAAIRNALDHKRDEARFPTVDAMLLCVTRLREAFNIADVNRYLPKVFWLSKRSQDEFGRLEYLLRDYMDRPLLLYGPSASIGNLRPAFRAAVAIPAGNLLGQPNSELVVHVREVSVYSEYWKNYPRRRRIYMRASPDSSSPSAVASQDLGPIVEHEISPPEELSEA